MSSRKSKRLQEFKLKQQFNKEENSKENKTKSFEYNSTKTKIYSSKEKAKLMHQINNLSADQISKIGDIIQSNEATTSKEIKNINDLNLDKYTSSTIDQLINFVNKCSKDKLNCLKRHQDNLKTNQDNLKTKLNYRKFQLSNKNGFTKLKINSNKSTKLKQNKTIKLKKVKEEPIDLNEYLKSSKAFINKKSNQCIGYSELANSICYICGRHKLTYPITEKAEKKYKEIFGFDIELTSYSPSMICGTCRCNLFGVNRTFNFSRPLIWKPATNHDKNSAKCDCYFDILNANPSMMINKIYPNSTCLLPEFKNNKKSRSKYGLNKEEKNKFNLNNDGISFNNNHQQQQQNTENINVQQSSNHISQNTFKSIPAIYSLESIRQDVNYISIQMNQILESNNFLVHKLENQMNILSEKIDILEKKYDENQANQQMNQNLNTVPLLSLILNTVTNQNIQNPSDNIQNDSLDN